MVIDHSLFEFPLPIGETTDYVTPAERLFVLSHLGVPRIDIAQWALDITGLANNPLVLTYSEILNLPRTKIVCAHQCAGNPLAPTQLTRSIANVEWGGVLLRDVLRRAGFQRNAKYLWAFGMDHGEMKIGEFVSEPQQHYVKDVPLDYITTSDTLLATHLNGRPISEKHGYPVRLIVPGFYGHNSVKWLCRVELSDRRVDGLFTTDLYYDENPDTGKREPVWRIAPESLIVTPVDKSAATSSNIEISEWAWSCSDVRLVEISTDGGVSWQETNLESRQDRSWQRFTYQWRPSGSGEFSIMSRATDSEGNVQLMDQARNAVHRIEFTVR